VILQHDRCRSGHFILIGGGNGWPFDFRILVDRHAVVNHRHARVLDLLTIRVELRCAEGDVIRLPRLRDVAGVLLGFLRP
jgi:hypothetical protein